jgi:hypothetical protein
MSSDVVSLLSAVVPVTYSAGRSRGSGRPRQPVPEIPSSVSASELVWLAVVQTATRWQRCGPQG